MFTQFFLKKILWLKGGFSLLLMKINGMGQFLRESSFFGTILI